MMKNFAVPLLVALISATAPASATEPAHLPGTLHTYKMEHNAQSHCPSDTVVWLNKDSNTLHKKGNRWYGKTKHGAFVCQAEFNSRKNAGIFPR